MPDVGMYRLAFNFTIPNGTEASVIRHIDNGGVALDNVNQLAIAQAAVDWWDTVGAGGFQPIAQFAVGTVLQEVVLTQMAGVPPTELSVSSGVAGAAAGDAPPPESALVSTWRTISPGRSFRGRSFWPGYAWASLDSTGLLAAGNVPFWQGIMENLINDINNAGGATQQFAVYSKTLDVMTPITGVTVRTTPHHQSRRNA